MLTVWFLVVHAAAWQAQPGVGDQAACVDTADAEPEDAEPEGADTERADTECVNDGCIAGDDSREPQDRESSRYGRQVPPQVEQMFVDGLDFLSSRQQKDGSWQNTSTYGSGGAGATAICTLALMARGDDPNWGPYAAQVRRGLKYVIGQQSAVNGRFNGNNYDLAFSLLLLAEAYGVVDDELLWRGNEAAENKRTIGEALELCVRGVMLEDSQQGLDHPGWRSTATGEATDASVAGSVLMGLLAARNAGIRVPDRTVDAAIVYLEKSTTEQGQVAYHEAASDYGNTKGRSALTALCLAVARRKSSPAYVSCRKYLLENLRHEPRRWPHYAQYYMAQALFHADRSAWETWNLMMVRKLHTRRNADGSLTRSKYGDDYATAMSLLTLAVNFRLLPIYER